MFVVDVPAYIHAPLIILSFQLPLKNKLDSLVKLQEIPNHLELLEKVLLDSAMKSFSTDLKVRFEL